MSTQESAQSRRPTGLGALVARSVIGYAKLLRGRSVHRSRDHLGIPYEIDQGGIYRAFRETVGRDGTREQNVVLVVGFRLRVLGNLRPLHWIFQRVCLLTTPFWSGFRGFRVKLWMVDRTTGNYLGIYEWSGQENAEIYADALIRVLRPLSTKDSVWYRVYPGLALEPFLWVRRAGGFETAKRAAFPRG